MYLRSWVGCGLGLALAFAALACGPPAEQPAGQTPEVTPAATRTPTPPDTNEVIIRVFCPPKQANGATLRVGVHPPLKDVKLGKDVTWTRTKLGPADHSDEFCLDVAPAERANWPWYQGPSEQNSVPLPWCGNTEIIGKAKQAQDTAVVKKYNFTVGCYDTPHAEEEEKVTFDPRMIVN